MPYHIRVKAENDDDYLVKCDLDLEKLHTVINSFRNGDDVDFAGSSVSRSTLQDIQIVYTDDPSADIVREIRAGLGDIIPLSGPYELAIFDNREDISYKFPLYRNGSESSSSKRTSKRIGDNKKVFVVHGRNLRLRDSLFDFLRSIELHPIEWSQAVVGTGKSSPYVGEILDTAFSQAQAVVVLLTPDDEARLFARFLQEDDSEFERELTGQPRPNVLFEAGMALGRSPEHTILVQVGKIRPFSDIGGRHVIKLDDSQATRQDLANRLKTAGCNINLDGTDWHTQGDFSMRNDELPSDDELPSKETDTVDTDLEKEPTSVLKALAGDDDIPLTCKEISQALDIGRQKAQYWLDELAKGKMVVFVGSATSGTIFWKLSMKGRKYLVEKKLL